MSWSDPRIGRRACLAGLLALPACGFEPVYGPGGSAAGLSGEIAVDPPRDRPGYVLVRSLEERLGTAGPSPAYRLAADLDLEQEGFGITPERDTTRIRVAGRLDYRLIEAATNTVVQSGTLTNFTAYSAPVFRPGGSSIAGNPVTIRAAEENAIERLMVILSDQLVTRLLATAPEWRS